MKRRFLLPIVALLLMSSCMQAKQRPGLSVDGKSNGNAVTKKL